MGVALFPRGLLVAGFVALVAGAGLLALRRAPAAAPRPAAPAEVPAQRESSASLSERSVPYTLLFMAKRYPEAITAAEEALTDALKTSGPDSSGAAQIMNDLGYLYRLQGDDERAAALHTRALEIRLRLFGSEDSAALQSMTNLAADREALREYPQAQALTERSLELITRRLGPHHPWAVQMLERLALIQSAQGRLAEAEALFNQALAILQEHEDHAMPSEADVLDQYARMLRQAGASARAEVLEARAREQREAEALERLAPQPVDPAAQRPE